MPTREFDKLTRKDDGAKIAGNLSRLKVNIVSQQTLADRNLRMKDHITGLLTNAVFLLPNPVE